MYSKTKKKADEVSVLFKNVNRTETTDNNFDIVTLTQCEITDGQIFQ